MSNKPSKRPATKMTAAAKSPLRGEAVSHAPLLAFGRTNWILMGSGVAAAVLGFVFLSQGDITIAPILLVAGYCALLPLGIVWSGRKPSRTGANSSAG